MRIKRLTEAQSYTASNHYDMCALRLQGFEELGPKVLWVGLSHFLPGGGAGPDASPLEKVYVVVAGEVTVRCDGREVKLGPLDSCFIGPDEIREVKNESNQVASMLVAMPYPEPRK